MESVLVLCSVRTSIRESKKLYNILDDLITYEYKILYANIRGVNQLITEYLNYKEYSYIKSISFPDKDIHKTMKYIIENNNLFQKVVIIGLNKNDVLTKYLDHFCGTNIDLYIVPPEYGVYSDASTLINQGAILLQTISDLKWL